MAREVIQKTWCDPCLQRGERNEGAEFTVSLQHHAKPRVIALCDTDRKEFYDPFAELVDNLGQMADSAAPAPVRPRAGIGGRPSRRELDESGVTCPAPDCGLVYKNRPSLQGHCRNDHRRSLDQLEGNPTPHNCTEPDVVDPSQECPFAFAQPQHLTLHKRNQHGIDKKSA